ncbi:MAG TPA: SGNH/GDSL hydrolase family protein [Xanthomonadaceae bacterium]|nr:SGNH/GDSL hydrolase family protein [Xanthomonadaceae bacterium]
MNWLALGDSYTIGEGVAGPDRWPNQLAKALRDSGLRIDDPRIIAATGWSTDELMQTMGSAQPELAPPYALVSLAIGVNDQYRGRDVEEYRRGFTPLLARAIALAGGRSERVLVLSIPDWGVTPFARHEAGNRHNIANEIDTYNAAARAICDQRGVAFVDITPISRADGANADMLVADGLHPSAAMYAQWTALALPVALAALQR